MTTEDGVGSVPAGMHPCAGCGKPIRWGKMPSDPSKNMKCWHCEQAYRDASRGNRRYTDPLPK